MQTGPGIGLEQHADGKWGGLTLKESDPKTSPFVIFISVRPLNESLTKNVLFHFKSCLHDE